MLLAVTSLTMATSSVMAQESTPGTGSFAGRGGIGVMVVLHAVDCATVQANAQHIDIAATKACAIVDKVSQ